MKIEVKLFFDFAKFFPPGSNNKNASISVENGTTVQGLVERLGLPSQIPKNILVNGIKAEHERELQESDSVAIFPPMAGG